MPYGTLLQLKINYIEYVERGNTPVWKQLLVNEQSFLKTCYLTYRMQMEQEKTFLQVTSTVKQGNSL